MLELSVLEQFAAFAACGTLSAAAQKLHISQPALSQSMKKLEEQLGVPLFVRGKNRLALNETGRFAAECAEDLLRREQEMCTRIRRFDRTRHTICLGACAPVPIGDLVPLLSRLYSDMTVSSELKNTDEALWAGFYGGAYQIIVVHEKPPEDAALFSFPYRQEHLALFVPREHPLARFSELRLRDLENQNLLLYTHIGFWYALCKEKLPSAHFLYMNEWDAFQQVAGLGAFPSFTTEALAGRRAETGKVVIPILDDEVNVTYYFVCANAALPRFRPLVQQLRRQFSLTDESPSQA